MSEKIGIIADKGLPEKRVKEIFQDLQDQAINHRTGESAELFLRIATFPMSDEGTVLLNDTTPGLLKRRGWDRLIYVTDLPLTTQRPVISQSVYHGQATMLCLPAFGLLRAKQGLMQELLRLVQGKPAGAGVRSTADIVDTEDIQGGDIDAEVTRVLEGRGRTLRLLLGMIRNNRPGVLVRVLSKSMALGAATGGFGIFYGSIWLMSHYMPLWRLIMIGFLAILAMSFWLIYNNKLWNPRSARSNSRSAEWWRARWDNYATLFTVVLSSTAMYLILIVILLLMSLVIVPIPYFSLQLEKGVNLGDYIRLAWFAASLGMIGGAIGSGFDSDDAIREATYNRRELLRRQLSGVFDDEETEENQV